VKGRRGKKRPFSSVHRLSVSPCSSKVRRRGRERENFPLLRFVRSFPSSPSKFSVPACCAFLSFSLDSFASFLRMIVGRFIRSVELFIRSPNDPSIARVLLLSSSPMHFFLFLVVFAMLLCFFATLHLHVQLCLFCSPLLGTLFV